MFWAGGAAVQRRRASPSSPTHHKRFSLRRRCHSSLTSHLSWCLCCVHGSWTGTDLQLKYMKRGNQAHMNLLPTWFSSGAAMPAGKTGVEWAQTRALLRHMNTGGRLGDAVQKSRAGRRMPGGKAGGAVRLVRRWGRQRVLIPQKTGRQGRALSARGAPPRCEEFWVGNERLCPGCTRRRADERN